MSVWVPRLLILFVIAGISVVDHLDLDRGRRPDSRSTTRGASRCRGSSPASRRTARAWVKRTRPLRSSSSPTSARFRGPTFQEEVVDPIIDEYVREGRAQISLRHFSFGRTGVTEAAIGADVAGEQGYQWQFAELVMRNLSQAGPQGVDEDFLRGISGVTPGLEIEEWNEAFADELEAQSEDEAYESAIDADGELASDLKLPAGPAMVITGIGGVGDAHQHAYAGRGPCRDRAGGRAGRA